MFELYDSFAFFRIEKMMRQQIGCDNKSEKAYIFSIVMIAFNLSKLLAGEKVKG